MAPIARKSEIRFALVGTVTTPNVWALFDTMGYSYNNYAVRSGYWPRLYDLSIPDQRLEPQTAAGMPSAVRHEGAFYAATVPLRTGLTWTDGTPFAADDVAFTVNTVLAVGLGFDWQDFYNPAWLDHAEAIDPHAVKFFYKQMPGVGMWQYGALQGPVVQQKYWASKVADAVRLLPASDLAAHIQSLKSKVADLQKQVDALNLSVGYALGEEARQTQAGIRRQQGDLDQAINDLAKAQAEFDSAMNSARAALYAQDDAGEPSLGRWKYSSSQASASPAVYANEVNPAFPEAAPGFARALYFAYATSGAAAAALGKGDVDAVLDPTAATVATAAPNGHAASEHVLNSPTRSLRFLVFNPVADVGSPARRPLRQAIACMLDQEAFVSEPLGGNALALISFVMQGETPWYSREAILPCQNLDAGGRLAQAVNILKTTGYTWVKEPSGQTAGEGLTSPNGKPVPALDMMAPSSDTQRAAAATYIEQQARFLGIPVTARVVTQDTIQYAVFSSHQYDLALLGWRVGQYPGYLCDWFGEGMPFHYQSDALTSRCAQLKVTSDLDQAHQLVAAIQAILSQELVFIPLYSQAVSDTTQNIAYPFARALDGLSGIYGAPALAFPALP